MAVAALALWAAALASPVLAHQFKVGGLTIVHPWSHATPKGAPVAAGYMVLRNDGAEPETLIGGETEAARAMQVHEMTMDGGVMKMRELKGGLTIPPGGSVELKPGGYHIMFLDPVKPFVPGEMVKATLIFEHAGKVPVEFLVGEIGGPMPKDPPGMDHGGMSMDHGGMDMGH